MAMVGDVGAQLHLPAGTVTFLLTDIEGSTALWESEPAAMAEAVARHYQLIDEAVSAAGGARPVEQGEGDSAVAAFGRPSDAVSAAVVLQRALSVEAWPTSRPLRVRMAIHTGEARFRDVGNYMGEAIIRTARLRAVAHGGQVLLSAPAHAVAVDRVGEQFAFRDLGVHRLKDLARPEQIFQLCGDGLPSEFPELTSLDRYPNNLPVQLSPFIGRAEEITTVAKLVAQHRLVTLCGSGGVGKTRLAQQVAAQVIEQFPDGVWWVELAAVSDADGVGPAIGVVMRLADRADSDVWAALARLIGSRRMLFVLDNAEHVVEAVATGVDRLLRSCAGLTVIATSRASLDVPGELTWRVPPLGLPDEREPVAVETLAQSDAVCLFADRAGRARPNFRLTVTNSETIATICRRLDGVALAIELAAVRVRTFTPEQILAGLDDALRTLTGGSRSVLPRQQTLEASVRWSHTLLGDFDRVLLRRLSVFRGGFSLDAVEAVAADELLPASEILDRLDHLVSQSLVVVDDSSPGRYRLLETVRQFAARQLDDAGEAGSFCDRHATYYAGLVRMLGPFVLSNRMAQVVDELRVELDNVRAALSWFESRGRVIELAETVVDAGMSWVASGLLRDGQTWLTRCIDAATVSDSLLARLYAARAFVRARTQQFREGIDDAKRAIELGRQLEDWRTATLGYHHLSECLYWSDLCASRRLLTDAVDCAQRSGDAVIQSWASLLDAHILVDLGLVVKGRAVLDTIRSEVLRFGIPMVAAELCLVDAMCAWFESDFTRALACAHESEAWARQIASHHWIGLATVIEELTRWQMGEHATGLARLPGLIDDAERLGHNQAVLQLRYMFAVHLLADDIDEAERRLQGLVDIMEPADAIFLLPWMFAFLAGVAQTHGEFEKAAYRIQRGRAVQDRVGNQHAGAMLEQRAAALARVQGEIVDAEQIIHRAMDTQHENGYRADVATSLEMLAGILITTQRATDAARLAGAAQAERDRLGFRMRIPPEREIYAADLATVEQALGVEAFAQAFAEGEAMSLDEAVAYAQRSRGRRGRPAFGWDSLTPTEQDVVALVIDGCTNVEIAQRLLMSRETVKTHLSHVYAKLQVRTRAQLAALAAVRAVQQR
jgi:predicted ATPase/class 3 adenylate cyclase/DNA-binding CsgD family transcriptional regulator